MVLTTKAIFTRFRDKMKEKFFINQKQQKQQQQTQDIIHNIYVLMNNKTLIKRACGQILYQWKRSFENNDH